MGMKILVACEESQAVTKELRRLGHEAYSCDIIECSGGHPEWHIMQDVLPLLNGNCEFQTVDDTGHTVSGKWDMIIAFPPCTYLSNAGACRLYPQKGQLNMERFHKGIKAKDFFLKFLNADSPMVAVENPVSSKVFEMPPYTQEIQPYMFGHPYTKKHDFGCGGYRNLNQLILLNLLALIAQLVQAGRIKASMVPQSVEKMQKNRAKTFPGIGKAMAEQWAGQCK